jgi:ribonuclease HI
VNHAKWKNLRRGSVAAIARSSDGVFLGASALIYTGVTETETLEALGCKEACDLARDIYASRVRVASDCKMVVQNLEQGTRGVYFHIITEIIEARQFFDFLEFKFQSRKLNNEAHKLARSALCDVSGRRM